MILQFGLQNDEDKPKWPHPEAESLSSRTLTSKGAIWCQIAFMESKKTVFPEYCCLEVTEIAYIYRKSKKNMYLLSINSREACALPRPLTRTLTCRHFRRGAGTRGMVYYWTFVAVVDRHSLASNLGGFIFLILNKHVI